MGFRRKRREDIRPELTPMVDVVFLLLIFFMISTTFVEQPGISVQLPESTSQQVEREPEEIKVYLDEEGQIYLKEEPVSLEQLQNQLSDLGDQASKTTFFLMADAEARHGLVVRIMDAAKEAGFLKLAVATEKKTSE
ncbi:MAG: biopolymer transporter ExbD [Desulfuromonadales bacterium]